MKILITKKETGQKIQLTSDDYFQFSEDMKVRIDFDDKKYIVSRVVFKIMKPHADSDLGSLEQHVLLTEFDDKQED